ncbi:hypothetical protein K466DRAFT_495221, partial [Polyporus arcularius HHB13444]
LDDREQPPPCLDKCPACRRDLVPGDAHLRPEGPQLSDTLYKCQDCPLASPMCRDCVVRDHRTRPLDRIRRWRLDAKFWDKVSLAALGHAIYLGHNGSCCPLFPRHHTNQTPLLSYARSMGIFHEHGLVEMPVVFCRCLPRASDAQQLITSGFWPATWHTPTTATTLTALDAFHGLSMQAHVNLHDYVQHLKQMTDGVLTDDVKDRYSQLNHSVRQYVFVKTCRRQGVIAGQKLPPKSLAAECPACPKPNVNTRKGWEHRDENLKHMDTVGTTMDGNYHMSGGGKETDEKDQAFSEDAGAFCHQGDAAKVVSRAEKTQSKHKEQTTCSNFGAMNYGKYNGKISGIVAVLCRHGIVLPGGVIDLHNGERFAYVDFVFTSAMQPHMDLKLFIATYDIMCQYIIRFAIRIDEEFSDETLAELESITSADFPQIIGGVGKYHLSMHVKSCREKFSMNHLPCACMDDGEDCERLWGLINAMSRRTKEMTAGHRRDVLNDLFYHQNVRRMHAMVATFMHKLPEAEEQLKDHVEYLATIERTIGCKMIDQWKELEAGWKKKVVDIKEHADLVSPYEPRTEITLTSKQIADHLCEERKAHGDRIGAALAVLIHDLLDLEGERAKMQTEIENFRGNERERSGLAARITDFVKRAEDARDRYERYLQPCVDEALLDVPTDPLNQHFPLRAGLPARETKNPAATSTPPPEHGMSLALPSDYDDKIIQHAAMATATKYERMIREGCANEALDDLRLHLTTFATMEDRRKRGSGVRFNTPMDKRMTKKKMVIAAAKVRYRQIRNTLLVLGMPEDDPNFKPLLDTDCKPFVLVIEEQRLGDSRRKPCWIWSDFSFVLKEDDQGVKEFLMDSLRVHWFRYSALVARWRERVETMREDMFRTRNSYRIWRDKWQERAEKREKAGQLGAAAYARR